MRVNGSRQLSNPRRDIRGVVQLDKKGEMYTRAHNNGSSSLNHVRDQPVDWLLSICQEGGALVSYTYVPTRSNIT